MKQFSSIPVFLFRLATFMSIFSPAIAIPSANDLLQTAKNNTHIDCNTQHLFYRNTTVIQQAGKAPTTMVQTTELFKKKPNLVKMITDDGVQKRVVISRGDGYLFFQDPTSGKFIPIKAPANLNPFADMANSLTDFASSDVQQVQDPNSQNHYEITVRGGKLPKLVDHALVRIDPQTNVVTHMDGTDTKGNQVLTMDATYQKIGNTYHPKHIHTESHTNNIDVYSDMDVVTNEVDQPIADSNFAIQ